MAAVSLSVNQALDSAPIGAMRWKVWFLSAMGVFLDGFDLFIMAVALPVIAKDLAPDAWVLGLIGAAAPLGAVIGAAGAGRLTDRFGRKLLYVIDLASFILFAGLSAIAWNNASLFAFRFLLGVGIGADYPISSSYVTEFMPARIRGRMLVSGFSFQAFGSLVGAGVGLLILVVHPQPDAWRWMLAAGIVPAVIVALLRSSLPESPRWCAAHGKKDEAAHVAGEITGLAVAPDVVAETHLPYRALFSSQYLRRTILAVVPWFLMDIGLYTIGFFTPTILAAMAFTGQGDWISRDVASTEGALFLDVFLVAGFAVAIWLVDRWGRIRLQILGFAGMTIGLLLLVVAGLLPGGTEQHVPLVFLGFALFNFTVNAGPNPTTFLLPAELFPTSLRASGHGLAAASGKVGAAVGLFVLPVLKDDLGLGSTLAIVAGACFLGLVITAVFQTETTGRSLEDISPHHRLVPSAASA
jgi:MFS family permease